MHIRTPLLLGATLALAAAFAAFPAQTDHGAQAAAGDYGEFSTRCDYSHANNDDPIVYPNQQGRAHRHHFFGNTTTNYRTKTKTLQNGTANCDRREDKSAYWVPALYDDGVELPFEAVHAYYRNTHVKDDSKIEPFPLGLRMVGGTDYDPDPPPGVRVAEWFCAGNEQNGTPDIPATCGGKNLIGVVTFPSCWDGVHLTTTNQSHMRYPWEQSPANACPSSHPVVLPELTEWVRYDPATNDQTGIRLSSGEGDTLHADFWNAWVAAEQADLVEECLIGGKDCGTVGN